jgi:hypothetical protein
MDGWIWFQLYLASLDPALPQKGKNKKIKITMEDVDDYNDGVWDVAGDVDGDIDGDD